MKFLLPALLCLPALSSPAAAADRDVAAAGATFQQTPAMPRSRQDAADLTKPTPPADPALAALDQAYAAGRAAALRLVLARYLDELQALEKSLVAAGDPAGAARVRMEHDRALPALGLPAVAAADADEFAVFEEPAALPAAPVLPVMGSSDLDGILKTLLPAAPAAAGTTAVPGPSNAYASSPAAARATRQLLRMGNATLEGTFDPALGYLYWTSGKTASWTLSGLAPGSWQLVLRYSSDEKNGGSGKLKVRFGQTKLETVIAGTGGWKRRRQIVIGPFPVTGDRMDLILEAAPASHYLMEMNALLLQPAGPSGKTSTP